MTKLFIDTNVIIDLLAKRTPFDLESRQIFALADIGKIHLIISSLSIVNTHYLLNDIMKVENSRSILDKFKVLVTTYDLNNKIIELALNEYSFNDFEDAIQYYTALEAQCEIIVTRNKKDFKNSTIPVFSPKEYLAKLRVMPKK